MRRAAGVGVLGLMLGLLALPSAIATGCDADANSTLVIPGDKSVSVHTECTGPAGPDASVDVDVVQDADGLRVMVRHAIDRDGDGDNETSDGQGGADVECPPPEQQGIVKGIVCPALTSL